MDLKMEGKMNKIIKMNSEFKTENSLLRPKSLYKKHCSLKKTSFTIFKIEQLLRKLFRKNAKRLKLFDKLNKPLFEEEPES